MGTVAHLAVRISANLGDFEKGLRSAETSFDRVGSKFQSAGLKLTAAVTLPIVAAAAGLVRLGAAFEQADASIRASTGATGKQLESLGASFRTVLAQVPNAMGDTATAIGDLHTRTGLMGSELEALSVQMLNLSRITGAEIAPLIAATTRVFGDWSIATGDQAGALDFLFKTSQATGIGVHQLSSLIVQFGAPLRALGFDFEQAAVMMGKWEKEGVNLETVLAGMRMGLSKFAGAGLEPAEALKAVELAIKGAGSEAEANTIAFQVFGKRAGVDMAKAIQEGRLSIDGLLATVRGSSETINKAADDTKTIGDRFRQMGNQIMVAVEPLAMAVTRAFVGMLPAVQPLIGVLNSLVQWFTALPMPVQAGTMGFFALAAALGPVTWAFGTLMRAGSALITVLGAAGLSPVIAWVGSASLVAASSVHGFAVAALAIPGVQIAAAIGLIGGAFVMLDSKIDQSLQRFGMFQTWLRTTATLMAWVPGFGPRIASQFGLDSNPRPDVHLPSDDIDRMIGQTRQQQEMMAEMQRRAPDLFTGGGAGGDTGAGVDISRLMKQDEAAKKAAAEAEAFRKEMDRLSGREAIASANDLRLKFAALGAEGIKPATSDLERYNSALNDAVDAMVRGVKVAEPLKKALLMDWASPSNQFASGIAPFITEMGEATLADARMRAELKAMTESTMGTLGYAGHKGPELVLSSEIPWANELSERTININWDSINAPGPGFLEQAFGGSQGFGANLSDIMMRALTGGGDLGKSIGGFFGGSLFGAKGLGGMFGASGIGGLIGGALGPLGTMLGSLAGDLFGKLASKLFGIGNAGRDLVKDFAASHGGFDALQQKLEAMGDKGGELWVKLTQGVGRNNPEQARAAIEEVGAALDAWPQQRLEAIKLALDGINARVAIFGDTLKTATGTEAKRLAEILEARGLDPDSPEAKALGIQSQAQMGAEFQGEFDRLSAMALGGFGIGLQQGEGPLSALAAIKPTLDVLIPAQQEFNFAASETAQRLFDIAAAVELNRPQFAALEADGQILRGMLQGNLQDLGLFQAVSSDITSQIGQITEAGMPMSQALALSQPVLQSLWEAQEKFGFTTDEATTALLNQASQQGIVGQHMKDVNQKILDVLVLIGDALGATIPDALRGLPSVAADAAGGMKSAFEGLDIKVPVTLQRIDTTGLTGDQLAAADIYNLNQDKVELEVPHLAEGGIVRRPTLAVLGDGGPEAVVPLGSGGAGSTVVIEMDGRTVAEFIVPYIPGVVQRYGLA